MAPLAFPGDKAGAALSRVDNVAIRAQADKTTSHQADAI
jgi:hypothetical protein